MSVDVVTTAEPAKPAPPVLDLSVILKKYESESGPATPVATKSRSPKNGVYFRKTEQKTGLFEIASFHFIEGTATTLHGHSEAAALIKCYGGLLMEEYFIPHYCDWRDSSKTTSPTSGTTATATAAKPESCKCNEDQACRYQYAVRQIRPNEQAYLPIGAFHRIHCLKTSPTINVYHPLSTNPVAPVPRELMVRLLSAKHDYLKTFNSMIAAPPQCVTGFSTIEEIVANRMIVWSERERAQNEEGATCIHPDTIIDFRATGILTSPVPIECGGLGDSLTTVVQSIRKLARIAPATALSLAMPLGNSAATRMPQASVPSHLVEDLQRNTDWLVDQVVNQRKIIAVANSEPGSGGEIKHTKTIAKRDPETNLYHLDGRKSFATIGPDADYFMCAARRVDEGDVVDGFFVARENVKLDDSWDPLGMRPTASVGLTLTHSRAECMLGFPGSLSGANARHWSTLMFTAVFIGVAEGALIALGSLIDEKTRESHYVRSTVACLALQIDAAAGFLEALANDPSVPYPPQGRERCNNAKSFAAKIAVDTAMQVSMLSGGRAYKAGHIVSQILRDSLAAPILRPPYPKVIDGLAATWLDKKKTEEAEL